MKKIYRLKDKTGRWTPECQDMDIPILQCPCTLLICRLAVNLENLSKAIQCIKISPEFPLEVKRIKFQRVTKECLLLITTPTAIQFMTLNIQCILTKIRILMELRKTKERTWRNLINTPCTILGDIIHIICLQCHLLSTLNPLSILSHLLPEEDQALPEKIQTKIPTTLM